MSQTVTAHEPGTAGLLEGFRAGKVGALARAITWVENGHAGADELLDALYPTTGKAWRTGITGPPGGGKSTLAGVLAGDWAAAGRRTALLAVDPSSPISGGALLGDRVRLDKAVDENGVFVRSMASRGSLGGLALAAGAAADLLDAFGFEEVLVETVGVGQAEVDIAAAADTTLVVLTPDSGDGVQAMKAGLMEVADLFVVNKSDMPGADRMVSEIEGMISLRAESAPHPEVVACSARTGAGMTELAAALERRRLEDRKSGRLEERRGERAAGRVRRMVVEALREEIGRDRAIEKEMRRLLATGERPDLVARRLVARLLAAGNDEGGKE